MKTLLKYKFILLSILILGLAALLRFPFLSTFPPSMVQDEVGLGYSAISIAQTGKDEWGNSFPLVFKSFGDYKPPAFFYVTALLYKIIGWQFVLPRVTSALAGIFVVLLGIIWIRKIFKSDSLGLIAGFVLAVTPWTVHLSRMALESNLGLAFFMAGLVFLSYAQKSYLQVLLSALFFSLSTYSYHGFRFTVILFLGSYLLSLVILNIKEIKKQRQIIQTTFLVLLCSTLLSLPGFLAKGATSRLDQTLIITSKDSLQEYMHQENNCHVTFNEVNPFLTKVCKLKYNKFSKPVLIGVDSLSKNISPAFLFFTGDLDVGRNPTQSGELYLLLFPLWMAGIFVVFKKYTDYLPLLVGYIVSLVPSTLAGDPHAIRMSVHIPFLIAVIVLGYKYFASKIKYFTYIFVIFILASTAFFVVKYAADTFATHEGSATYLSYAKNAAQTAYQYAQKGYVVYSDHDLYPEPHIYYAYWNRIDPKITQASFANVYEENAGFSRPNQFGESVFFQQTNIKGLVCNIEYTTPTVFITNDPLEFTTDFDIKENTNTYTFVYLYNLESMRSQQLIMKRYCNQ